MPAKVASTKETTTHIDADGNEKTTIIERTQKVEPSGEPDYIKLYTRMWLEFNQIPLRWHELFLQMVQYMSYADANDLEHSQIVIVYGGVSTAICKACGWKDKSNLRRGLKELCNCGAIRRVDRATYQINPKYAGRGEWRYNPKYKRGGVEDLVAIFKMSEDGFNSGVKIVWADDGEDQSPLAEAYRKTIGKGGTLKERTKKSKTIKLDDIPGQLTFTSTKDFDNLIKEQDAS